MRQDAAAPRPMRPAGRALVTGASGFVGGWLLPALVAEEWSVWATANTRPPAAPTPGR